jgi:parallel beta-helix repeat protein
MANRVLFNGGAGITLAGSSGSRVLGNEIRENVGSGLELSAGRDTLLAGNAIVSNGLNGIQVTGNVQGSAIVSNTVVASGSNGLLLNAARGLSVGEIPLDEIVERVGLIWYPASGNLSNTIVTSAGYGLLAVGDCNRTRVIRNLIGENTLGNVDLSSATGITYVP